MLDRRPLSGAILLAALGLGLVSSCDNPTCVFVDGCTGSNGGNGPGGLGNEGATFPEEGAFMAAGAPTLVAAAPQLQDLHPRSPVFVEFSESLSSESLSDAFRIIDVVFQQEIPLSPPALVGDGRVVVLVPLTGYAPDRQYQLLYGRDAAIQDLNGEAVSITQNQALLDFAVVDASLIPEPRLIYSYPPDLTTLQGDASEIVIGFDRQMETSTFTADTFDVLVDGLPPAFDPPPESVPIGTTGLGFGLTQVWRWIPRDADGRSVSLGADVQVKVKLAQGVELLTSVEGDVLPASETEFQTLGLSMPVAVRKVAGAGSADSFSAADVFGGAPIVEIQLAQPAPSGVTAEAFLFGKSPQNNDLLKATAVAVDFPEGTSTLTLTAEQLGMLDSLGAAEFADGDFECAIQLRRFGSPTGARLFDGDAATGAAERSYFDTVAPTLLGLGAAGADVSSFVGDLRDLAIVGRASEPVSFAFVDAGASGTNGGSLAAPPQTAFSGPVEASGEALFVTAAVPAGAINPNSGGVDYELSIYDRAGNSTTVAASGTYLQRGVIGPGGDPTGANVLVRVYDRRSLRGVNNATVFSHAESGGALSFEGAGTTSIIGVTMVPGATAGNTVITVDAPGYDLFTFHGVPSTSLEVLLDVSSEPPAGVQGTVTSVFPTGNFTGATTKVADTRAPRLRRLSDVSLCSPSSNATTFECPYGPVLIETSTVGAISFLATQDDIPQFTFNPITYLRGFGLTAPLLPVAAGETALDVDIDAGDQLAFSAPALQPFALPPHVLDTSSLVNLGPVSELTLTAEAVTTGLGGSLIVGRANPYPLGGGGTRWTALGAVAGLAGAAGDLQGRGAIDGDLLLRAAVRDAAGNEVAARPRLSSSGGQLVPIDVPRLLSPSPGGSAGPSAFNLVVEDTLPDSVGGDGLTEVQLTSSSGRKWKLWTLDTADASGDLLLSAPDLAAEGGAGLPPGALSAEVRIWGWDFDRGEFLWSDIEREYELSGFAAAVTFTLD
ncbi:MAG: hypothetical protein P8M11_07825 [Planctomycetota bacterium]|nr:hypothetical protein [Planctomycetota bacterium]MDG1984459.1 hypothetical protein [Planctomycetota bacterium]